MRRAPCRPRGRVVEIYGPESSGKTTVTLHCVAEQQKKGGVCAFVDAEHALDPQYAKKLGVDLDELLISQPDTGEQALEITDTLVRSGAVNMVVVDSVAALTPNNASMARELDASLDTALLLHEAPLPLLQLRRGTVAPLALRREVELEPVAVVEMHVAVLVARIRHAS